MLFRVLTLSLSILLALGIFTQVIWPALCGRDVFPLFRGESRLTRAERLRVEAIEKKATAEREAEAFRVQMEAEEVDAQVTRELIETERRPR
jgi:hypothetical protein